MSQDKGMNEPKKANNLRCFNEAFATFLKDGYVVHGGGVNMVLLSKDKVHVKLFANIDYQVVAQYDFEAEQNRDIMLEEFHADLAAHDRELVERVKAEWYKFKYDELRGKKA